MATTPAMGPNGRPTPASAEQELAARNAELAAWADRSGHDLMTPLAVISGMAETLASAWDRLPETDRVAMLDSIRSQAARATTLLDDGLALMRSGRPGEREAS